MNSNKLTTSNFDISGNTIKRLAKYFLISRILPVGNNRGGPGWKCLFVLGIFHYFGKFICRFERRFDNLKNRLRSIKSKLQK